MINSSDSSNDNGTTNPRRGGGPLLSWWNACFGEADGTDGPSTPVGRRNQAPLEQRPDEPRTS